MNKERIATFDIMKGIAMLLVIVGHCQLIPRWIPHWIYSFHMPLFFLLSGWFFKPSPGFRASLTKNAKRLLVPFFITAGILVTYNLLSAIKYDDWRILKDQLVALLFPTGIYRHWMLKYISGPAEIGAIWFIAALFWCRVTTDSLLQKGLPEWSILLIGIVATLIDNYIINLPFGLLPGISASVFLFLGYYFSKHALSPWVRWLCLLSWPFAFCYSGMSMNHCHYTIYPLDVLGACGGTLFVWYFSRFLERFLPRLSSGLKWIGRSTLAILCIHTVLMNCYILEHIPLPDAWYVQLPIEICVILALTWICSKISFTRNIFGMA